MGINSSLNLKKSKVLKISKIRYEFIPPNIQQCMIGEYIIEDSKPSDDWSKLLKNYKTANPIESLLKDTKNCRFLTKHIRQGVPVKWRWVTWKSYINLAVISFSDYVSIPPDLGALHQVIKKDIDRTFPNHYYFDKEYFGLMGQFALLRVLSKFASSYPQVGYCQGMNFIAGFLLLVSGGNEIETFSMLEAVIYHFSLKDFFTEGMVQLKKTLADFDSLFAKSLKQLYWHFKVQDLSEDLWVLKWFITLFTAVLPLNLALHVWDIMMVDGVSVLPNVTICILKYFESELMTRDAGEILVFLSGLKDMKLDSSRVLSPIYVHKRKNSKLDGKIFPFLHPRSNSNFVVNDEETPAEPASPFVLMSQCEITEDPLELPAVRVSTKHHSKISYKSSMVFEDDYNESTRVESKGDDNFDPKGILNDLITEDYE